MPISNYSVLAGTPTSGKVVSGASTHYQITMQAPGGPFTIAVNIQSVDGSEVLYAILQDFKAPNEAALLALRMGMTALDSAPGGLALDFVRSTVPLTGGASAMITRNQMTLLPESIKTSHDIEPDALQNSVTALLDKTIADKGGIIYAFGSAFSDSGKVDGIHDIHMNQGNPIDNHGDDNGIWQDGALFIHLPAEATWTAVFIAFQTESWNTDQNGDPD